MSPAAEFDMRMGKMPPRRYYGDIAIQAGNYDLPTTPATWAHGAGITFGVFLNNQLPDCTHAALQGHAEQVHSTRRGHPEKPADEWVRAAFHATGLEQGLSDSQGRYMEGVLSYARRVGFQQSPADPQGTVGLEKILGYAAVNPLDLTETRAAGYLFGGLYVGIALPVSAYYDWEAGRNWSCRATNNAPGGWGGHAVWVTAINTIGPVCATWGKRKQMTWCFWKRYVDECYAVVTDDWATPGTYRDKLLADLASL
jgi:hypothetical protein